MPKWRKVEGEKAQSLFCFGVFVYTMLCRDQDKEVLAKFDSKLY